MEQKLIQPDFSVIESVFIRHRNCLLLRGEFTPIYTDYYLHLMQHGLRNAPTIDSDFKKILAYFTLHMVSRPWAEYHAWTLNLKSPYTANLFVCGSSLTESVAGRAFVEDIRIPEENMLYTQMIRNSEKPQTSVIVMHGDEAESWVEDYYRQSEQRGARCFDLGNDCFALLVAQPDADCDWLQEADVDLIEHIDKREETKVLEKRRFRFQCGCTIEKILPTLKAMKGDLADILSEKGEIEVTCPRCAAVYRVTTDMLTRPDSPDQP